MQQSNDNFSSGDGDIEGEDSFSNDGYSPMKEQICSSDQIESNLFR